MTLTSRTAHASHQEQARAILLQLSGQARRAREAFLVSASVENVHALRGALRRAADGVGLWKAVFSRRMSRGFVVNCAGKLDAWGRRATWTFSRHVLSPSTPILVSFGRLTF